MPVAVWAQADWTPSGTTTQGHFVCAGGPADGRLVPGDQLVKINNVSVDDLTPEQATEIIRSAQTAAFTNTHAYAWWLVHTLQLFKIKQCIPCVILTPSLSVLFFFSGSAQIRWLWRYSEQCWWVCPIYQRETHFKDIHSTNRLTVKWIMAGPLPAAL